MKKDINKINLSTKVGTVAYVVVNNKKKFNEICMSSIPLSKQKILVIDIIKAESKNSPSQLNIITIIHNIRSSTDLLMYLYNIILAGDDLAVIKV